MVCVPMVCRFKISLCIMQCGTNTGFGLDLVSAPESLGLGLKTIWSCSRLYLSVGGIDSNTVI